MLSIPVRTASSLRGAWLPALGLLALAACASRPTLPYDVAGLVMDDPCTQPVTGRCPPTLAYDMSVLRWELAAPFATARTPAPVRLVISLLEQRLFAYRDGVLAMTSPVSTGKPGHATPPGLFHITQKLIFHRSNRYSNAPMPYMERLTSSGIALHAGHLPGYPASHGCIRLPLASARRLYRMTSLGTPVVITRTAPGSTRKHRRREHPRQFAGRA